MTMSRSLTVSLVAPALLLAVTVAHAQTITFEEPAVTTPPPPPAVRYGNSGVLFAKGTQLLELPQRGLPGRARSQTHVLLSSDLAREFDPEPLEMTLTQAVEVVTVYTGMPRSTERVPVEIVLTGFDAQGSLVDSARTTLTGPTDVTRGLRIAAPPGQHLIVRVRLEADQAGASPFEFLDDLTLTAEGPPPVLASEPPVVTITSPTNGSTSTGQVTLSGRIVGTGLFPALAPPVATIAFPAEPGSGTLPDTIELELGTDLSWLPPGPPNAPGLSFSRSLQLTHLGNNTITVSAANAAGTGSAQVSLLYLPSDIASAYNEKGGQATFGGFGWSETEGSCLVAIYEKGAIFSSPAGVFFTLGDVFAKWKAYRSTLGCAVGAQTVLTAGVSQDFSGGRVYSGPAGTYYVVEPFVDAIDRLDFVAKHGLPVTDPVHQETYLLPRLWQKFRRSYAGVTLDAAMEVTDKPLTLWVAHPDVDGAQRAGVAVGPRTPTVWRQFPCPQQGVPCTGVGPPQSMPGLPYSQLVAACGGSHYPGGSPSWVPVAGSAGKIRSYSGTITSSGLAGEDAPWCHACSTFWDGEFGFAGVDWTVKAVPDPGYEHMVGGDGTTITQNRVIYEDYFQKTLEVEYEYCLVGFPPPSNQSGYYKKGDRLVVAGRFISDCGCHPSFGAAISRFCHKPYRSEIHPPALVLDIYTDEDLGKPVTVAEMIYLDWWYPNETVELDLFPPPRPTANSVLSYAIPLWTGFCPQSPGASGYCGFTYSAEPAGAMNHVSLTFTGRPDVPFNTPPQEDWDGQLHHGYAEPLVGRPVVPNRAHKKSIWGEFELGWYSTP